METIAIADDHDIVCEGVHNLMEVLPECRMVGQASGGHQAVDLVQRLKPDLLITDLIMPDLNGIEVVRQVRRIAPQTRVLIYPCTPVNLMWPKHLRPVPTLMY
jgi:DNA-binding NarL/FixJ family response regulator